MVSSLSLIRTGASCWWWSSLTSSCSWIILSWRSSSIRFIPKDARSKRSRNLLVFLFWCHHLLFWFDAHRSNHAPVSLNKSCSIGHQPPVLNDKCDYSVTEDLSNHVVISSSYTFFSMEENKIGKTKNCVENCGFPNVMSHAVDKQHSFNYWSHLAIFPHAWDDPQNIKEHDNGGCGHNVSEFNGFFWLKIGFWSEAR